MIDLAESYANKRVFVTGHTGFKGSWLCAWLRRMGCRVTGYALDPPAGSPSLYDLLGRGGALVETDHRHDLRDADRLAGALRDARPDVVFHLAAQSLVRASYLDPVGTFTTNVIGTVHLLEAVRQLGRPCVVVVVTTDKCYENQEWLHPYREEDKMGGHDAYSASKGCAEIATAAYRRSFFQEAGASRIATARAGNVIGGGDWATDRIVPDVVRALRAGEPVAVRNPHATRPWQHVLEPLGGYLELAVAMEAEGADPELLTGMNFGPAVTSNRSVAELVGALLERWPGSWENRGSPDAPHEASKLNLAIDKAYHLLGWRPAWGFRQTLEKTCDWYREEAEGADPLALTERQIAEYEHARTVSYD